MTGKVRQVAVRVVVSHDGLDVNEVFVTEDGPWVQARLASGYLVEVPRDGVPADEGGSV